MAQAIKGGQYGQNGEWYEGGQFLPNTELPKRGGKSKRATKKQEIAPYDWQVAPTEEARSIYTFLAGTYARLNRSTQQLEAYMPYIEVCERKYPQFNRQQVMDLIAKWNKGERWFS